LAGTCTQIDKQQSEILYYWSKRDAELGKVVEIGMDRREYATSCWYTKSTKLVVDPPSTATMNGSTEPLAVALATRWGQAWFAAVTV